MGDTRPISFCQFSPDSNLLATGSWSVSGCGQLVGVVKYGMGVVTVGVDCASYGVYQVVNQSEH